MRNVIALVTLALFVATVGFAQEAKTVTLKGYVVDQMCAKNIAKKENMMEKAAGHSKQCTLEDACAASGFGIFSEGKYYKFDEKGSAKAQSMIENSKREKELSFEATGKITGETFVVATLKEASAGKSEGGKKQSTEERKH